MSVDLGDLLTPATVKCPIALALNVVDKQYRAQLVDAIQIIAASPTGRPAPIPQKNIREAFQRLGHPVPRERLTDHIRGRCACG